MDVNLKQRRRDNGKAYSNGFLNVCSRLICLPGMGVIACLIFMFKKDDKQEALNNKKWEEE